MGKWKNPDYNQYEDKDYNSERKTNKNSQNRKNVEDYGFDDDILFDGLGVQKNLSWDKKRKGYQKDKERRNKKYRDYEDDWN